LVDQNDLPPLFYARIAGVLYLIIIVFGIFSEVIVRSNIIVVDAASATVNNIMASRSWFRLGFAADSIMLLCDVAIAAFFYVLFKSVNKTLSLITAAFRLTQAAILGLNLLNYYSALLLLTGTEYTTVFNTDQLYALVMLFLDMHSHGYDLGLLFFGISNFILGYLIIKSNYFPSLLGYGLIVAAVVYLSGSYTRFLSPESVPLMKPFYLIPLITELLFCFYLLVRGLKTQK
jgi:hypothetical protein